MITATRSPLHTALCDRLGIRYPICQAGTTSSSPRERSGDGGVHAHGPDNYKQKIAALDEEITVVTRAVSGKPNRQIRNAFTREWEGRQAEIEPFPIQYERVGKPALRWEFFRRAGEPSRARQE